MKTPTDEQIQSVLETLRPGKGEALRADVIRRITGLPRGRTEESVREIVKILIFERGIPVGSCSNGYYLIQTPEELEEVVEDLSSRAAGCLSRARRLLINFR